MKQKWVCIVCVLLLAFIAGFSSFQIQKTHAQVTPGKTAAPLRELTQKHHIDIGSAISTNGFRTDPQFLTVLAREFNIVTPENAMKWGALHQTPDQYYFKLSDAMISFAQANHMKVRGHTLVWYGALPAWLTQQSYSKEALTAILKDHIQTVVGHFRGEVSAWDVVNEAVSPDGNGLRDNIWLQGIGPDYIAKAFQWAHEADPNARLYYNDYNGEGLNKKSDTIYQLVKALVYQGIPIHGVGLQMHRRLSIPIPKQDIIRNLNRIADLGLETTITEADVNISDMPTLPLNERLALQAQIYKDIVDACLEAKNCKAVVFWGFTDKYAYNGANTMPLLFDANYSPKPSYYAVQNRLSQSY